jgi:hypothetical protein
MISTEQQLVCNLGDFGSEIPFSVIELVPSVMEKVKSVTELF